jgi:hypothetical protein
MKLTFCGLASRGATVVLEYKPEVKKEFASKQSIYNNIPSHIPAN